MTIFPEIALFALIYMGYVGFGVTFAIAVAALWGGSLDSANIRWMRPWANVAWLFLTLGIALGSYWAYYELGWGGWWFWDPVENASFMPWLVGTALIHSMAATEKRDVFKAWTVLLAIVTDVIDLFRVRMPDQTKKLSRQHLQWQHEFHINNVTNRRKLNHEEGIHSYETDSDIARCRCQHSPDQTSYSG